MSETKKKPVGVYEFLQLIKNRQKKEYSTERIPGTKSSYAIVKRPIK